MKLFIAPAVLAAVVLAACGAKQPDELVADAKSHLAKRDLTAATIELKNALQANPKLPEARYLLAKALLENHEAAAAIVELKKAAELGHPADAVVPLMARAMLAAGEGEKVIVQYARAELDDQAAMVDLRTSVSIAYAARQDHAAAQRFLNGVFRLAPSDLRANIFQARLHAATGDGERAFKLADLLVARHADDPDVLQLQGDLLWNHKGSAEAALASYGKALARAADSSTLHAAIISIHLARSDLKAAKDQLAQLRKLRPGQAQVLFFDAEIALRERDPKKARELVQRLLRVTPENARVLQLAGAVELESRSLLRAEQHLTKAFQLHPGLPGTRELLARTYLALNRPGQATATLAPLLEGGTARGPVLTLAAAAHLQAGDVTKAMEFYSKAVKADPSDVASRTALAMGNFAQGKPDVAFSELQAIAANDSGVAADLALVNAHLARKDIDRALRALDALEEKQPGNPVTANLRGKVLLMKGDVPAARQQFERAISADPGFFAAAENLAALDMKDKRPDLAQGRLEAVLSRDPKNVQAILALARLREAAGASKDDVIALIRKATAADPADTRPRALLVNYLLLKGDFKRALASAHEANASTPDSPELVDLLGRAQLATGDGNQAVNSFSKLASLQPKSAHAQVSLADAYMAVGNSDAALQSVRRALAIEPDSMPAQQRRITISIKQGRPQEALDAARTIQREHAKSPTGFEAEGDIHARSKNWQLASVAYRAALQRQASGGTAKKLHGALMAGAKRAEAAAFATEWLEAQPRDGRFLFHLANMAIHEKKLTDAEALLLKLVALEPDNAAAVNNLAWTMVQLNKPGALAYAEKANKLLPDHAPFLDTMATVLAAEKRIDKAIDLQLKAVKLEPENHSLRLHLARLYLEAGNGSRARAELDRLSVVGDKFPQQKEVQQLRERL